VRSFLNTTQFLIVENLSGESAKTQSSYSPAPALRTDTDN
jgi:hypothetical protein